MTFTQCGQIHFQLWGVCEKKTWLLSGVRCRKIKMLISEYEMKNTATMKTFLQTILSEIILILDHRAL